MSSAQLWPAVLSAVPEKQSPGQDAGASGPSVQDAWTAEAWLWAALHLEAQL